MVRHCAGVLGGALLLVVCCNASVAQAAPLEPEQEAIARRLDGMSIAPCCFSNTLAEHRSPMAERLRQELRTLLAAGATEQQVLDTFVATYGERILAAPPTRGFNLLAYVVPCVALAAGLGLIGLLVWRHRPRPLGPILGPAADIPAQLRARFETELAHFEQ